MKNDQINDPFKNLILDDYEKEIEASLERGEWIESEDAESSISLVKEAAQNHIELRQSKKITFRINQGDLIKLKAKATKKNIPYQTLLGALVRDFVEGEYVIKL